MRFIIKATKQTLHCLDFKQLEQILHAQSSALQQDWDLYAELQW